jgi:two-component system LytT family response regulator
MEYQFDEINNILRLRHCKGRLVVQAELVVRVESCSNYSRIYFIHRKPLLVSKILYWFQEILPEDQFVRVHRSHLINKAFVKNKDSMNYVELKTGELIPVSRRRRGSFKKV